MVSARGGKGRICPPSVCGTEEGSADGTGNDRSFPDLPVGAENFREGGGRGGGKKVN